MTQKKRPDLIGKADLDGSLSREDKAFLSSFKK